MTEATEPVDAIVFAGASLAPFFLNDPRTGDAADAFAALAELDVAAAAAQWPFAGDEIAAVESALAAMKEGLADERTPEDHIGLMLALLSFLAAERPELVDDYLRDHLLTWAPHYLEALEEAAEQPFYVGLARLTRLTLVGLQRERGLTVELPRFYR